ncbi:MAG TPA: hypothetical protein VKY74_25300 [Chloroflexia bacterium]|nr:hypothetical protein [Chloroflexia bacterium]
MKPVHPGGPGEEILVAWQDGDAAALLDNVQEIALAEHLAGCARCQAYLHSLAALETDLASFSLAGRPAGADFTRQVLAALPPRAAAPVPIAGPAVWWGHQALAAGLVLTGLLILLATSDVMTLLAGWWQHAGDGLSAVVTSDGEGVGNWLNSLPGTALAPEAYLGLVLGAVILALGAGAFMVRTLAAPEGLAA